MPRPPHPPGRFERALLSDAAGFVILSLLCIARAFAIEDSIEDYPIVGPAHMLDFMNPSTPGALVWGAIGIVCLASAWLDVLRSAALGLAVGVHIAWAVSFMGSWLIGVSDESWVFSLGYFGIVMLSLWAFARGKLELGVITPPRSPKGG